MSRAPRPTPPASTPVDPRENPGSYIRQTDGTFVQAAAATIIPDGANAAAPAPVLPAESAAATAQALADLGHEIPPAIEAALAEPPAAPTPETPASGSAGDAQA